MWGIQRQSSSMSPHHWSATVTKNQTLCGQASLLLAVRLSRRKESWWMAERGEVLNGFDERRPPHEGTRTNQVRSKSIPHPRMVTRITTTLHIAHSHIQEAECCETSNCEEESHDERVWRPVRFNSKFDVPKEFKSDRQWTRAVVNLCLSFVISFTVCSRNVGKRKVHFHFMSECW